MGKCISLIYLLALKVKDSLLGHSGGTQYAARTCIINTIYSATALENHMRRELGLSLQVKHTTGMLQPQENTH